MSTTEKNGRLAITNTFNRVKAEGRAALMPYVTLGHPNRELSIDVIEAIAPHCDLIELGVPFSDPLADGPTIQNSTQLSLENGTTSTDCLEMVQTLRQRGVNTPFVLMGYYNPILAYGLDEYVRDAAAAGANGFIVPDLPSEEAEELENAAADANMVYVHFLAPTSNPERINNVAQRAGGFIYLVSITGTTGAASSNPADLAAFVNRVKAKTDVPLAVGFGIKTPEQTATVGQIANGVIVGSALVNIIGTADDPATAAADFVRSLREALN